MKKEIKVPKNRILNGFSKILVVSVVVATILNAIFFASETTIFLLNENQLLYLFSAMAQVIGGVFGLTLTAYVFFVDKFKESTDGDDTLYDAATSILSRYFRTLISLAMYRNGLVHGIDFDVTQTACKRIKEIYDALKDVLDTLIQDGKDSEKYSAAIARLHELG